MARANNQKPKTQGDGKMFIIQNKERQSIFKKLIDYSAGLQEDTYLERRMEIQRLMKLIISGGKGIYQNQFDFDSWDLTVLKDAGVATLSLKSTYMDYRGMRLFPIYEDRSNLKQACAALKQHIDDACQFIEGDHLRKTDEWEDFLITLAMLHYPHQDGDDPYHWDILQPIFSRLIDKAQCYEASNHNGIKGETDSWMDHQPKRIRNKRKD